MQGRDYPYSLAHILQCPGGITSYGSPSPDLGFF